MANTKIANPELFNLGDSTSATQLPVMTTAQRIAITTTLNIDYLVVGGGGAGSSGYGGIQGGSGGGGGLITSLPGGSGGGSSSEAPLISTLGTQYTVTVGSGAANVYILPNGTPTSGGDSSVFDSFIALGGGSARSYNAGNNLDSAGSPNYASGGGGSASGASGASYPGSGNSASRGYNGANGTSGSVFYGGGGGGAGGPGSNTVGGAGKLNAITGNSSLSYAGGGGNSWGNPRGGAGQAAQSGGNGNSGVVNTGGGGGGGLYNGGYGGDGGDGVVILRYATADVSSYTTTGLTPTPTTDGTDTILSFTTVGTGTINFTPTTTSLPPPSVGEMIFNSDTDKVEYWDGTAWYGITYESSTSENPYSAVVWTGTGGTNAITGVGFQPDLIWIKNRTMADSYAIVDSVRGISSPTPYIASDRNDAQGTSNNMPTSVQSDGFTITGGGGRTNTINENYVAWCFKGGGAAVPNTDGSIASQVSANVNGGFSIVKYTGGALIGNTVGHGLSSAPELILQKATSSTRDWNVFNYSTTGNLHLNENHAANSSEYWAVNSSTFAIQDQTASANRIAYCFHSVPGYSKIGNYTGNGSTNGPTVPLGFQPTFLMCKETSNTGNWRIMDNTRQSSNPHDRAVWANLNNAESTSASNKVDFNSDNFQVVGGGSDVNASGQTYMYLAFA